MNTLHPAQSVERCTLSRIRSSTSTLFRDATYIWEPERRTSLCIRRDITRPPFHHDPFYLGMLTASHYPSLCSITNGRTSSSSREIYRQLGHDVSGRLSSNRPILKTNWLDARVWRASREIRQGFLLFFFLNSTLENFLSFLKRLICESMKRMHVVFFNFIMVL